MSLFGLGRRAAEKSETEAETSTPTNSDVFAKAAADIRELAEVQLANAQKLIEDMLETAKIGNALLEGLQVKGEINHGASPEDKQRFMQSIIAMKEVIDHLTETPPNAILPITIDKTVEAAQEFREKITVAQTELRGIGQKLHAFIETPTPGTAPAPAAPGSGQGK